MSLGVVSAIGVDHTRSVQRVAAQSANRRDRVDQRQQLRDVVDVRAGQDRGKRRAVGVGDDVVLGTGARTIGRVWPSFWPPQRRESMMNRQRLARSRSGLLLAASRAATRASGPTRPQPASRVAVANMSRPSRNLSRRADSVVPMPEVNSSPRKLTAPRGHFETVSKAFVANLPLNDSLYACCVGLPA